MKTSALAPWHWWNWLYNHYPRQTIAAIALLVLLLAPVTYLNDRSNARQDHTIAQQANLRAADNETNALVNCENANQSRHASWALWNYVLTLTVASTPNQTPEAAAFVDDFRRYVGKVYQAHDCSDLSRKYPLPAPPQIPAMPTPARS